MLEIHVVDGGDGGRRGENGGSGALHDQFHDLPDANACAWIAIVPPVNSDKLRYSRLGLGMRLDVAVARRQVGVTGEQLNVPKRPPDRRDLSSGVGDEGPSAAVAGTSRKAEVGMLPGEKVHDRLGEVWVVPLYRDHQGGGRAREGDWRRLRRAALSSRLRGMTRPPPLPLLASLVR